MQFKFEEDGISNLGQGRFWLYLSYTDGKSTRDIASEWWRNSNQRFKQYLPESNFIDPFDPTEQELAMFALLYGTESKDEYLKWMNAVIKHNKEKEDEKQS
mgnify:CR=1 FL=1